jgi:uncharacterized protein
VITLLLALSMLHLETDTGFEKRLPIRHPYIQTYLEHQNEFGGANRILIAVRAEDGDIFDPGFFAVLKEVTDEVFFLPSVNRSSVRSIFTPNVRFIEIAEWGFSGDRVVSADFRATSESLERVRENAIKAGIVGSLVANDFSAAMISAELMGNNSAPARDVNYLAVAKQLEERIRKPFTSDGIDIHVIGFAAAVGEIALESHYVLVLFGVSFLVTSILVYLAIGSIQLMILLVGCSLVAVVWTFGLFSAFGFGLDPMAILVPSLVFAIGVSHGVQLVTSIQREWAAGICRVTAARRTLRRLVLPGTTALLSDAAGFLAILLIGIRFIQELALMVALGVTVLIVTNMLLLPLLLSLVGGSRGQVRARTALLAPLYRGLSCLTEARCARFGIAAGLLLLALGLMQASQMRIGDLKPGIPELSPTSRYNRDAALITDRFDIGVDVFTILAETRPDGCIDHRVMAEIDRFAWHMANVPGVQSTVALPQIAKVINAGWNEGGLKWRVLPRDPSSLAQAVSPVTTGTGLLNGDCSIMPVYVFAEDHTAETIEQIVRAAESFSTDDDVRPLAFHLASGNLGIMAATNEVVERAQVPMLVCVYGAIVLLTSLTFRSFRGTLCIVLPLGLVSVLIYAVMSLLGIGLKVTTLTVAALGVGIGVDYGIYLLANVQAAMRRGLRLPDAYAEALRMTGSAVLVAGITLAAGAGAWAFSSLQLQADMGLLLAFAFLANMVGALVLLPSIAWALNLRFPQEEGAADDAAEELRIAR